MSRARFLFALTAFLLLCASAAFAAERAPLLQEGKKTLFQRVVVHPGAGLLADAKADAAVKDKAVKPFSVFYVYARKDGFVEVGPASNEAIGWVKADLVTDWPQALTLLFTDRAGREPVLFFKDEKSLTTVGQSDDIKAKLGTLTAQMKEAQAGKDIPDLPVLAAEPTDAEGAVSRSRFYLMPIRSMSDPFEGVKFLRVASIDPGSKPAGAGGSGGADGDKGAGGGDGDKPQTMRTGIVFVIDTTISMKPYIDESLKVIRAAFDNIEKQKLGDSVGFAVVAFRSSTAKNPDVEYVTKVVSDFKTLKDRAALESALAAVQEAKASTHSFDEDSLAGVKTAVDDLSWNDYQSRIMVLITDAGPLPAGDPLASVRMGPTEMLDYAKAKNIWVTVAHVRSPSGDKDHAYAEKAYRDLTRTSTGSSAYIPIPAPTPAEGVKSFSAATKVLAESLTKVVRTTAERKLPPKPKEQAKAATPEEEAARIGDTIGYAVQLEFLGKQKGLRAPSVVEAWIADMDLAALGAGKNLPAVEPAVLLTKNQLSDLQKQLGVIIDQAERTKKTDSKDFFAGILSASAQLARDPAAFSAQPGKNLSEMGVLGEFLDGLPYKSDIMLLTEEDWYRMSVGEQTAFVNRLKSRIARYEEYDKDRSNWESFGAKNAGDWVYRVPLSMLP